MVGGCNYSLVDPRIGAPLPVSRTQGALIRVRPNAVCLPLRTPGLVKGAASQVPQAVRIWRKL